MISIASAQEVAATGANAAQSGGIMGFLPLILILVFFWFIMIRPQMKRTKEHKQLVESLQKGDEVVTQGGLAGRISKLGENYVALEAISGAEVLVQRAAIVLALPKGTLKSAL
ncbi:MAG: preprotein translocase subunit YajC [Zoogloeaceae bacterium]|jgi:preprotein translocase subunit YajC|nr:preprotein translocase subunit YajC [Zoogloeaceae bacterium]